MSEPVKRRTRRSLLSALATLAAVGVTACAPAYSEIPIETPLKAKLDVTSFQRVLIAGFVAGGTDEVDANQETVRLLRSQLRSKSSLRVIDADTLTLADVAQDQSREAAEPGGVERASQPTPLPAKIKDEKDIEPYERLFANTAYWKKLGEEYQNPLIVTGTVLFTADSRSGFVSRDVDEIDSFGRHRTVPTRTFLERKGFVLRPKFVFIDGRTGATMYQESYREEVLYAAQQNTPALSSYFELMDRLVPNFLSTLSTQKVKGTRVLLQ